jgi:histone deacetylase 11
VVHYLQTRLQIARIMIIDLDAHQGNGYEKDLVLQDSVYIVDCYNHRIYPKDSEVKEAIGKNLPIQHSTSNEEYLKLVC